MSSRKRITYSSHSNHAARSAHVRGERQFKTYDTSHIRPKRSKGPIIFSVALALIVLVLLIWGGTALFNSCSISSETLAEGESVEVVIPDGSGAKAIGTILEENKVVSSSTDFVNRVNDLGVASDLKPGTYTFTGVITLDEVIDTLRIGPNGIGGETFTVPEGYTAAQTAARVEESFDGSITADDFLSCVHDATAYEEEFPFVAGAYDNSVEGFLFPKTYPISKTATADSVVRMMLSQYQTEVANVDYSFSESGGLSSYQVLVLASLIEREASLEEERSLISSVIYNRLLKEDMLLQIDASVAYATGVVEITPDDLSVDSPYNTYLYKGLPPGPICSPGLASIQAAANPAETDYLYYVAANEDDGSHYFSTNYDDHLAYIG